jgi:serine/threonine protein kinase
VATPPDERALIATTRLAQVPTSPDDIFSWGDAHALADFPVIGEELGHKYLLTHRVGEGSSGVVFRAEHQALLIPVAVKVLKLTSHDHQTVLRQLRTEARLLARIDHPNCIRVLDLEMKARYPYIVLEFIEGTAFDAFIRQMGRIAWPQAVRVIQAAASGLQAAWEVGIVHRDIKPANLLIARKHGTVKLADLGLATVIDQIHASTLLTPTAHGTLAWLAGTAAYMPPEQAELTGKSDFRGDMYALGVTLFQAITGQLPFTGATPWEVIQKHQTAPPPTLTALVPGIPPELDRIVAQLLAKAPANRPASYAALLADLDRLPRGN